MSYGGGNLFKFSLKIFLVLLSVASCWVIYVSQDQKTVLDQFSNDYVEQLNTSIKDATRNYLLPAQSIAKIGAHMFRDGVVTLDKPNSLSTFVFPFIESYPQLNGYYIGTEAKEFLYWGYAFSPNDTYLMQIIEKDSQGALVEKIYYFDAKQKLLRQSEPIITKFDPLKRNWYQGAKALGAVFWSDVYAFSGLNNPSSPGITASYPIYDPAGGHIGVWGVDISLKELSRFVSDIVSSSGAYLVIFNEQENVIAHSGFMAVQSNNKLLSLSDLDNTIIKKVLASYRSHGFNEFFFKEEGRRYLASYSPFLFGKEKDWHLLLILPESQLVENMGLNLGFVVLFACIVLIISVIGLLFMFSPSSTSRGIRKGDKEHA